MSDESRASAGTRRREPEVADRLEVARSLVGEHQRHPIDAERLDDAR